MDRGRPGGTASKFTFRPKPGWNFPLWSPDGTEIVFASLNAPGQRSCEMRRKRADMIGGEETLAKLRTLAYAWDRTADGKSIVYSLGNDLWQLPLEGARTPIQLTSAPTGEHYGQVSPDGRWLAYAPGDRSDMEVYAQPTSPTGAQWLISTDNRSMPRWRRDGKELFYRAGDGRLMVVPVLASSDRGLFSHGAPRPLPLSIPDVGNVPRFKYQPSADGQRFLLTLNAQSAANPSS